MIRLIPPLPLLALLAAPLTAQEAASPLPPGLRRAEILQGWQTPEGMRIAALKIELEQGWKTYWRVPGDAGIPPVLDFAASGNIADVRVIWPAPEVFEINGMRAVGYHDGLLLPLEITPANPARPIALSADLDLGICHEICVPVQLKLASELLGPGAADDEISAAMQAQPAARPGLAQCRVEPIRDGVRVEARIALPESAHEVALFELRSTPMWVSDSVMRREGANLLASAEFVPDNGLPFALDQSDLRITVLSAAGAIEIDGCPPLN